MNKHLGLGRYGYGGLFMVTLATLMYEILLTRIFSVTMWYHFAFMAISIALFGMTVGAIVVYMFPRYFVQDRVKYHLALSSFLFSSFIVVSFLIHIAIPFGVFGSWLGIFFMTFTYVVISIPFIFSGICIALALTKFPKQVSRLYAADLAGAAIGTVALVYVLKITDGPTAVIFVASLASVGALLFALEEKRKEIIQVASSAAIVLLVFAGGHTILVNNGTPLVQLGWVKGKLEAPALYEKWNSFSRVRIIGNPDVATAPSGSTISATYDFNKKIPQLFLHIDANAGTVLTKFDGNVEDVEYLKYDLSNLVHYIRPNSDVLVIGTGGGRDILSALVFDQKSVVGVEINNDILEALNGTFGDFTGNLDQNPKVRFVNDEARSYVTRYESTFDIIQASMIDTWAATAAGAFVLSESSLYTVEAWREFFEHLSPSGVLTFTRWYFQDTPGEMYRLTSLASASLKELGIENPRDHIMIVRRMLRREGFDSPDGVGTILISKKPFSEKDVDTIEEVAGRLRFDIMLSPKVSLDQTFTILASAQDSSIFLKDFPINIAPPTDDNPFFFQMLRIGDVWNRELWNQGRVSFNMKAIVILGALLLIVIGLTLLCIIIPLVLKTKKGVLKGSLPLFLFFGSIGFGFMLVEISQMQRLIIFLGHPTYSLSVVLFSLLLSAGIGSYLTERVNGEGLISSALMRLFLLLSVLMLFGVVTPSLMVMFAGSSTMVRILVAVAILFPLGLFMGMAFPLGMKLAARKSASLTPWLWGINGATSVVASVLAISISLSAGISVTFWIGFLFYISAVGWFLIMNRQYMLKNQIHLLN